MSTVRGGGAQKSVHPLKCPSKSLVPLDLDRPSDSRTSGLGRRAGGPGLKTDECGGGGGGAGDEAETAPPPDREDWLRASGTQVPGQGYSGKALLLQILSGERKQSV